MEPRETYNDAEEFVYRVCKRSFLSLWSYANPQGKDPSKELCDILVVCEPDIIIFSVKDIKLTDSGDTALDWERWHKRAIEASCRQIYGAEKVIKTAPHVIRKDGTPGQTLSRDGEWRIHRVAVAVGSKGQAPIQFGDFGKGFVHVFDEVSFGIILQELDTITDFISYLTAKESLYASGVETLFEGAEEDLLALYLHQGRQFPEGPDLFVLDDNLWKSFVQKPEYRRKKEADRDSYIWDRLIEEMCAATPGDLEVGPSLSEEERVVRTMACETRFCRRLLGQAYREFLTLAQQRQIEARMMKSLSDVGYIFLHVPHGQDKAYRTGQLKCRCYIARGTLEGCKTVVGISTEEWQAGQGCSSYLMYLHMENWTEQDEAAMRQMREETGYFKAPRSRSAHEDEYPELNAAPISLPSDSAHYLSRSASPKTGRNNPCPCGSGIKYKKCHGV